MAQNRAATRSRPSLLELSQGVFSLILSLRGGSNFGEAEPLRQRITGFLNGIESEGFAAGVVKEDLDAVRFALVAFLDETILKSQWLHREEWRDRPLQLDLFGERLGGTRFFNELDVLRRQGDARREVLEVYHLCLTLGFEGQYQVSGQDRLQTLIADLRNQLGYDPRDRRELKLSPHGKRRDSPVAEAGDDFPFWRIAGIAAGVLVVLFVIFVLILNHHTGQAVDTLEGLQAVHGGA